MSDRESDREIWQRIKETEDAMTAIHLIADVGYGAVVSRKRDIAKVELELGQIKKILLGNGDPTNSILAKVNTLMVIQDRTNQELSDLKYLIIGDVKKGVDNESLLDRVQHAQKMSQTASKLVWIILTFFILELLGRIMGLF